MQRNDSNDDRRVLNLNAHTMPIAITARRKRILRGVHSICGRSLHNCNRKVSRPRLLVLLLSLPRSRKVLKLRAELDEGKRLLQMPEHEQRDVDGNQRG